MGEIYKNLNEDQWLLRHAQNTCSLSGEDGILQKIFEVLPPGSRWCVEFGAWDGKKYSNTYHLMQQGWSGVFIEADSVKFRDLLKTFQGNPKAHCVNCFVNFEGENSLQNLLKRTNIPRDFDLLSIDIDGNDYHIWESFHDYQPRVVVIEFNPTIPSDVEFVQPRDMSVQQGSAPLSLIKLGKAKGYELVCMTEYNAIFVTASLLKSFNLSNNDITRLRPQQPLFQLFQLYDGTFVVQGITQIQWNGLPIRSDKFQILPKMFRVYPCDSLSFGKRILRRIWTFFYLR